MQRLLDDVVAEEPRWRPGCVRSGVLLERLAGDGDEHDLEGERLADLVVAFEALDRAASRAGTALLTSLTSTRSCTGTPR